MGMTDDAGKQQGIPTDSASEGARSPNPFRRIRVRSVAGCRMPVHLRGIVEV